jgi:hypothetical protein
MICRKNEDYEDHVIIVKDYNEAQRRYEIIQSRIEAAEMLGIGTSEYEKLVSRPVHLAKGLTIDEDDKIQFTIHTIQKSKTKEGNVAFCIDMDVWN